jgi:hypothetical protein
MENNYQLGQRICIKNIRYHTMADAQIVRITKHYLFCCKGQNQLPDNNNYFLYGNYAKSFEFGDLDDLYDDSIIQLHKNNTYKLKKI